MLYAKLSCTHMRSKVEVIGLGIRYIYIVVLHTKVKSEQRATYFMPLRFFKKLTYQLH